MSCHLPSRIRTLGREYHPFCLMYSRTSGCGSIITWRAGGPLDQSCSSPSISEHVSRVIWVLVKQRLTIPNPNPQFSTRKSGSSLSRWSNRTDASTTVWNKRLNRRHTCQYDSLIGRSQPIITQTSSGPELTKHNSCPSSPSLKVNLDSRKAAFEPADVASSACSTIILSPWSPPSALLSRR